MNPSGPRPGLDTLEACIWLEYLLLGDLRQLLDEPSGAERRTWLTALLTAGRSGRAAPRRRPWGVTACAAVARAQCANRLLHVARLIDTIFARA